MFDLYSCISYISNMGKKKKKMEIKFHPAILDDMKKILSSNPIYAIPRWFSNTKWDIIYAYQRVVKGYDERWSFNLNTEFATHASKALGEMIKYVHGHPSNPFSKKKGEIKNITDWKVILRKIKKGFDAANQIMNNEYVVEANPKKGRSYYRHNKAKHDRLYREFNEGMDLFKKYYFNLWD